MIFLFAFPQYISIFAEVLFRSLYSGARMKRESGESPEQSRCCEFHRGCITLYATILKDEWEGGTSETSQKTCKTFASCVFEERIREI